MTDSHQRLEDRVQVPLDMGQKRFDQIAAALFSDHSRSRIQQWIKDGHLTVDGQTRKPRDKLIGGETLELDVELVPEERWEAEPVELAVVHEDDDIIVIDKPVGLVVHPGAGTPGGTVLNGLLYRYPELKAVPRAGIVHRLDKDTSGLMVVARTLSAHTSLVSQLQDRTMGREYEAVVTGVMTGGGVVDEPIGRHPTHRIKMAVTPVGKEAITHYRVLERYRNHTLIRCKLETGRTHQIRVHMAHIGYPLVGDQLYAGRNRLPKDVNRPVAEALREFKRQALHAAYLELVHPATGEPMGWQSDMPDDMIDLLAMLEADAEGDLEHDL
ncbi:23S rRNA pseudouridine(1911/1915/1917) synthase RluD [Saccharospirillum salsuginis]|uniref:Pseudouridine synthase n=1 Tax=Saccharospirillum salsuginis TaxID=418750 RepID=A0A918K9K8_9GAMM|nr:23S rRNA pseudouridine(1911/1915/1917) synthase RluD [Saccharospirillum salsuginis]GGX55100.1 ribosomal large subunit pseudouridine synthase D [Saccharospirillum salsuginis]